MAFDPNMVPAEEGRIASSAEYNKVANNVLEVHQKNLDQDSWLVEHLGGVASADATHDTINDRLSTNEQRITTLENADPSSYPVMIVAQRSANINVDGGANLQFSITDIDTHSMQNYTEARTYIPEPGIYEFELQVVFNGQEGGGPSRPSGEGGGTYPTTSATVGAYITMNGTSGATDGLAAFERAPHTGEQTVLQTSGKRTFDGTEYLTARVWGDTGSNTYVRGRSHGAPYGGTYLVVRKVDNRTG